MAWNWRSRFDNIFRLRRAGTSDTPGLECRVVGYLQQKMEAQALQLPLFASKVKVYAKQSAEERAQSVVSLFLLYEQSLLSNGHSVTHTRRDLLEHFPELEYHPYFSLVFFPFDQQKIAIATLFMAEVLRRSEEAFGALNEGWKKAFEHQLALVNFSTTDDLSISNYSKSLFAQLESRFGRAVTKGLFQEEFYKLRKIYQFLPSFSYLLSFLPVNVLDENQVLQYNKAQMEEVLLAELNRQQELIHALNEKTAENKKIKASNLAQQEQLFRVLECNPEGVVIIDEQGMVVYSTARFEALFGWKRAEIHGVSYQQSFSKDAPTSAYIGQYCEQNNMEDLTHQEGIILNAAGEEVRVAIAVSVLCIEDARCYCLFFKDISERLAYERKLKDAKILAEESAKAKAEFLSIMSHEIRTPLNAVVGLTNILIEEDPKEEQVESLQTLRFSAENLLSIINDILDFSKIESGKVIFESIPVNLGDLCHQVLKTFESRVEAKGLNLVLNLETVPPLMVLADPTRINQILTNLIGNALKFTEEGEIKLSCSMKKDKDNKAIVNFKVQDTGIGIAEDKQRLIFERFAQAESNTTRQFGGTGLGLSITKSLIDRMGGFIGVKSEEGKGACFYFEIKLDLVNIPVDEQQEREHKAEEGGLRGVTVILAEDNPINVMVATKFLNKWAVETVVAKSGVEVLEALEGCASLDLILMDLQMPVMDGFTACRKLREGTSKYKNVPVIALSASVLDETKKEAEDSGMNDFITKPFKPDELFHTIKRYAAKSTPNQDEVAENPMDLT